MAGAIDVALSLAAGSREAALLAVRGTLIGLGAGAGDLEAQVEQAGVRLAVTHVHTRREWLESVVDLAARGELTPTAFETFVLVGAVEAHRAVASGHGTGKVVLLP
ncbi:zinc-binding dehydrogenase [Actinomyces sp. Marseille-P3109]|uniref:zinc-binding dehydrogenase n=1 Tax=Actinomyces sp. Marseille-P3109 TaxID=2083009 RepID=UPI00131EECF4|nr:zinc-binding dehydrogenase [Actinomyces sp. Marseille-P3109]